MIRTVIFDMDGVIIDTEPLHQRAFFTLFAELEIPVSAAEYATFLGKSTRNVFQRLKTQYSLVADVDTLLRRKRELFNEAFDTDATLDLLPGVRALMVELRAHGVQLVVASSASNATIARVFDRFGLRPYFTHLVSGEDFAESKPNPAIFLRAAELAGTPVEECIVIEDAANGVAAAKAANIYCIAYASPHSAGQDLYCADRIIQDFAELSAVEIMAVSGYNNRPFAIPGSAPPVDVKDIYELTSRDEDYLCYPDGTLYNGIVLELHGETVIVEYEVKAGLKDGVQRDYYCAGYLEAMYHYREGIMHGDVMYFNPDGSSEKCVFEYGVFIELYQWDEAGNLARHEKIELADWQLSVLGRSRQAKQW